MAVVRTVVALIVVSLTFVSGILVGQTERFELEGNMKLIGATSGIIFHDGTKQTTAGVGSANDIACTGCVGNTDLAGDAVGSAQVALDALTAADLAADAVGAEEIAANAVGASEIATDGVGAAEIVANAVGTSEIATDGVGADEIGANAVGTSEIATDGVGAAEIAAGAVGTSEVGSKVLRLSNMSMTVFMNYTLDLFGSINNGACSNFSGQGAAGVAANSFALVFGVRPAAGGANPGWIVEGEDSPSGAADVVRVRVCNFTGANADPPNLRFNFWTIAQ